MYDTMLGPLEVDPVCVVNDTKGHRDWVSFPKTVDCVLPVHLRNSDAGLYDHLRSSKCCSNSTDPTRDGVFVEGKFVCHKCDRLPDSSSALSKRARRRALCVVQGRPVVDQRSMQQCGGNPTITEQHSHHLRLNRRLRRVKRMCAYWKRRARTAEAVVSDFGKGSPKVRWLFWRFECKTVGTRVLCWRLFGRPC